MGRELEKLALVALVTGVVAHKSMEWGNLTAKAAAAQEQCDEGREGSMNITVDVLGVEILEWEADRSTIEWLAARNANSGEEVDPVQVNAAADLALAQDDELAAEKSWLEDVQVFATLGVDTAIALGCQVGFSPYVSLMGDDCATIRLTQCLDRGFSPSECGDVLFMPPIDESPVESGATSKDERTTETPQDTEVPVDQPIDDQRSADLPEHTGQATQAAAPRVAVVGSRPGAGSATVLGGKRRSAPVRSSRRVEQQASVNKAASAVAAAETGGNSGAGYTGGYEGNNNGYNPPSPELPFAGPEAETESPELELPTAENPEVALGDYLTLEESYEVLVVGGGTETYYKVSPAGEASPFLLVDDLTKDQAEVVLNEYPAVKDLVEEAGREYAESGVVSDDAAAALAGLDWVVIDAAALE